MLSLICAISEYDQVRDLASGRVRAEGIELSILNMPVEEVFFRVLRFREFDICEMSMGWCVSLLSRGDCPFVAIPVFPSRMFRHSFLYVGRNGSVVEPGDLKGKSIGIPEWAQTAGIYARGMLADCFGVAFTAKERSMARLSDVTVARYPIPWLFEYVGWTEEIFGKDYWPYGIEANRTTLMAFLQYAKQQGTAENQLTPDDLFAPEVRAQFKV